MYKHRDPWGAYSRAEPYPCKLLVPTDIYYRLGKLWTTAHGDVGPDYYSRLSSAIAQFRILLGNAIDRREVKYWSPTMQQYLEVTSLSSFDFDKATVTIGISQAVRVVEFENICPSSVEDEAMASRYGTGKRLYG